MESIVMLGRIFGCIQWVKMRLMHSFATFLDRAVILCQPKLISNLNRVNENRIPDGVSLSAVAWYSTVYLEKVLIHSTQQLTRVLPQRKKELMHVSVILNPMEYSTITRHHLALATKISILVKRKKIVMFLTKSLKAMPRSPIAKYWVFPKTVDPFTLHYTTMVKPTRTVMSMFAMVCGLMDTILMWALCSIRT